MFANGAALLGMGQGIAWVTLVDLSDEILCSKGPPLGVGVAVGRFVLAPGEACASQVNFQITTKRNETDETKNRTNEQTKRIVGKECEVQNNITK